MLAWRQLQLQRRLLLLHWGRFGRHALRTPPLRAGKPLLLDAIFTCQWMPLLPSPSDAVGCSCAGSSHSLNANAAQAMAFVDGSSPGAGARPTASLAFATEVQGAIELLLTGWVSSRSERCEKPAGRTLGALCSIPGFC